MRAHASVNLFLPSPARWTNSLNSTMVAPGRAAGSASSGSTAVPWHIVASPFPRLGRASSTRACRCFHGFPKFFGEKRKTRRSKQFAAGCGARVPAAQALIPKLPVAPGRMPAIVVIMRALPRRGSALLLVSAVFGAASSGRTGSDGVMPWGFGACGGLAGIRPMPRLAGEGPAFHSPTVATFVTLHAAAALHGRSRSPLAGETERLVTRLRGAGQEGVRDRMVAPALPSVLSWWPMLGLVCDIRRKAARLRRLFDDIAREQLTAQQLAALNAPAQACSCCLQSA